MSAEVRSVSRSKNLRRTRRLFESNGICRFKRFFRFFSSRRPSLVFAESSFSLVRFWGAVVALSFLCGTSSVWAASYKTANFVVEADSIEIARKIGDAAERCRKTLAVEWLGAELPNWFAPCSVSVAEGEELGAGGETVFTFSNGEVYDWKMTIQGSEARLLDSVLPHEVTHTVLASYLRAPAPRWLDEGIATSVEADVERTRYRRMLSSFLHSKKGIAFNDMVAATEYPDDLMPFYSQSFSVCEYLILIGGRRRLVEFAKCGCETRNWNEALRRYYRCDSLGSLQLEWIAWVAEWDARNMPDDLPQTRKLPEFNAFDEDSALAVADLAADSRELSASSARATKGSVRLTGNVRPLTRGQSSEKGATAKNRWFGKSKGDFAGESGAQETGSVARNGSRERVRASGGATGSGSRGLDDRRESRTALSDGAGSATRARAAKVLESF